MYCVSSCDAASNCLVWVLSDDVDDWDLDECPKPSEVQNELYANNEDEEEDEGEDLEGRKVMVRCSQDIGI